MKFLVDAQLPKVLAELLAKAGHECLHTLDLPEGNRTSDSAIRDLADTADFVVITKDSDFVDSHVLRGKALNDSAFVELSEAGLVIH